MSSWGGFKLDSQWSMGGFTFTAPALASTMLLQLVSLSCPASSLLARRAGVRGAVCARDLDAAMSSPLPMGVQHVGEVKGAEIIGGDRTTSKVARRLCRARGECRMVTTTRPMQAIAHLFGCLQSIRQQLLQLVIVRWGVEVSRSQMLSLCAPME